MEKESVPEESSKQKLADHNKSKALLSVLLPAEAKVVKRTALARD